jgi:hypothetical protein
VIQKLILTPEGKTNFVFVAFSAMPRKDQVCSLISSP